MKCPNDNTTLIMTERSGVEIDYCPECRGVWLDRGELDKIIERSSQQVQGSQTDQYGPDKKLNTKERNHQRPRKKNRFLVNCLIFSDLMSNKKSP